MQTPVKLGGVLQGVHHAHLSNVCHEHLTLRSYIQKPILMDMIYEAVEPIVHRQSPGILQLYRENRCPEWDGKD